MDTVKIMLGELVVARESVAGLRKDLRDAIVRVKTLRDSIKTARFDVRESRKTALAAKAVERKAKAEARAAAKAARIAKLEAKLLALKSPKNVRKANQKPSKAKVYTPAEVAALNAWTNRPAKRKVS